MRPAIPKLSWIVLGLAALAAAPALSAEQPDEARSKARGQAVAARSAPAPAIRTFKITAADGAIVPAHLTVRKGERVRITFVSTDGNYGIKFKDFGIKEKLTPETPVVVNLTASEKGTFEFRCTRTWGIKHWSRNGVLVVD